MFNLSWKISFTGISFLEPRNEMHNPGPDLLTETEPPNDGVEHMENFLQLCHSYNRPRSDLLNSVNAILLPHGFSPLSNEVLLKFIFTVTSGYPLTPTRSYLRQPSNSFMLQNAFRCSTVDLCLFVPCFPAFFDLLISLGQ